MKRLLENTIGHRYFLLGVRIVLGFIFIFASIEKIAQPEEFAKAITNYRLLPTPAVNLFAIVLPWVELLAGLFFSADWRQQPASLCGSAAYSGAEPTSMSPAQS